MNFLKYEIDRIFQSVLRRYNYGITLGDTNLKIEKANFSQSSVQTFYISSIIAVLFGICITLFFSLLIGIILILITLPVFIKAAKTKKKERNESSETIVFTDDYRIEILKENEFVEFEVEGIEEINFNVEKDKDISVGTIAIVMKDAEVHNLIKIYGDNKRYVEDDTEVLVNHITALINDE